MTMKRSILLLGAALALFPAAAGAGAGGARLEAGAVFLTKSGKIGFGTSAIESDAGFALRGRLRLGLGAFSIAGEIQGSSQDYGSNARPENLNATFLGVNGAFHPITIARLTPYAEVGVGRLLFSDESITEDEGIKATHFGLGVFVDLTDRVGLELGLRRQHQGGLGVQGSTREFKYEPKLFSVLLSLRL